MDITQQLLDVLSDLEESEIVKELDKFMFILSHLRSADSDSALNMYYRMIANLGDEEASALAKLLSKTPKDKGVA